jgi:TonB-dependent starch-binding outer membrane protein SusC
MMDKSYQGYRVGDSVGRASANWTQRTVGKFSTLLTVLVLLCFVGSQSAFAQGGNITGKVTASEDGSLLPGVAVQIKGTTRGTNTDADGVYKLSGVANDAVLVFSFIGTKTVEVPVGNRSTVDVKMVSDQQNLEEVVVVGYGTQKRKEISGTVSSVSSKEFNAGILNNPLQGIQGKVAGLVISAGNADPAAAPSVRLRGNGTLYGGDPLYVVDGVPGVPIQNIPAQDIESIDVLRDASSAAIYGARGANGVIIVTTKRGRSGRAMVDYSGQAGVDMIAKAPAYLTADEYRNAVRTLGLTGFDDKGANTNWFKELTRPAFTQSHAIGASGGTDKFNYRASLSYLNQQGVARNSGLDRLGLRINMDQKAINDRLSIAYSLYVGETNRQYTNYQAFTYANTNLPTDPVRNPDGSFFERPGSFSIRNPVSILENTSDKSKITEYIANVNAKFKITDDLTAGVNVAKKGYTDDRSYFQNRVPLDAQGNKGVAYRSMNWGTADNSFFNSNLNTIPPPNDDRLLELTMNYNKSFGNNTLNALAGYSYQDVNFYGFIARNNNFINDDLTSNNLGGGLSINQNNGISVGQNAVQSDRANFKLISFFARAQYSMGSKYFATVTVRRDGSTKFGANNKWGLFPSASFGWSLSEEDFMKGLSWLDNAKVRVNYGLAGNSEGIRPYSTLQLLAPGGRYFEPSTGQYVPSYVAIQNANPNLKWEVGESYGLGLDFSILKTRLTGSVDWYVRNTRDLIFDVTAPLSINPIVPNILANVGSMRNAGVEILLNGLIVNKGDFQYSAVLAAAFNKNKVVSLSSGDLIAASNIIYNTGLGAATRGTSAVGFSVLQPGYPVGQFFGAQVTGIDDKGKYIFRDVNGDGANGPNQATSTDRTYIGSPQPTFTPTLTNTFSYKNWNLSFVLNGRFGNKIMNTERILFARQVGRFVEENTLKEAVTSPIKDDFTGSISYFVEPGDFVRLQNARLGYRLPSFGAVSRAEVFVSGTNLFLLTKFKGVDPELNLSGVNPGIYTKEQFPRARGFQLGVNIAF